MSRASTDHRLPPAAAGFAPRRSARGTIRNRAGIAAGGFPWEAYQNRAPSEDRTSVQRGSCRCRDDRLSREGRSTGATHRYRPHQRSDKAILEPTQDHAKGRNDPVDRWPATSDGGPSGSGVQGGAASRPPDGGSRFRWESLRPDESRPGAVDERRRRPEASLTGNRPRTPEPCLATGGRSAREHCERSRRSSSACEPALSAIREPQSKGIAEHRPRRRTEHEPSRLSDHRRGLHARPGGPGYRQDNDRARQARSPAREERHPGRRDLDPRVQPPCKGGARRTDRERWARRGTCGPSTLWA